MRANRIFFVIAALSFVFSLTQVQAAGLRISDRTIKEDKRTHNIEFHYPQTGIQKIDKVIADFAIKTAKDFARDGAADGPSQIGPWSAELNYEVSRNDDKMFSVSFVYYTFSGGAHPNNNFYTFTFLMPSGEEVRIYDLFTSEGIKRISKLSIESLAKDLGGEGEPDMGWIGRGAAPNAKNFENFVLKPNELEIDFDSYQVAAYAVGPQEVHIPLGKLKDVMRSDPLAPQPSFDCALAKTPVEKAICGSRPLSRLDHDVADEYADKLLWMSEDPERNKIRNEQRAWIAQRDASCGRAGSQIGDCLIASYQKRLEQLRGY